MLQAENRICWNQEANESQTNLTFPDIYADVLGKKEDYNRITIDPPPPIAKMSAHMQETELALA